MFFLLLKVLQIALVAAVSVSEQIDDENDTLSSPPHIIFMLIDDMGWYNAPWNGNMEIKERMPFTDDLSQNHGLILDRHYSYKYCSPARSSFLSGRLPIHVTQNNKNNNVENPGGADLRMELLPELLKKTPTTYFTSCIGKWHVGARSTSNLPTSRGFDHHFGFLKGGEDHYTQESPDNDGTKFVDLYANHNPAFGRNGTYSTYLYAAEAVKVIEEYAANTTTNMNTGTAQDGHQLRQPPLFMYLAWQAMHGPLEAPPEYIKEVPNDTSSGRRSIMNGMGGILDEGIRNVTTALRQAGLYNNTLLVVSSDNGGWIQLNRGGNNYPLRGGKVSDFEGGVRTAAFVAGGYLEKVVPHLIGTRSELLIHLVDWYATLVGIGGGRVLLQNLQDERNSLPAVDSKDFWKAFTEFDTTNNVTAVRREIPLSYCNEQAECDYPGGMGDSALISWPWKIINGTQAGLGLWQGVQFPNSTLPPIPQPGNGIGCPTGCLFNLEVDPTEHFNVKDQHSEVYERLWNRLIEIGQSVYQTNYDGGASDCIPIPEAYERDKGFVAPRCSSGSTTMNHDGEDEKSSFLYVAETKS